MTQRMALYMQDKHPIQYELDIAAYAEGISTQRRMVGQADLTRMLRRTEQP
jgi:hypothetical protein